MAATRVLVVDDSLTMRALISGALERIPHVEVVGLADGADEARALAAQLNPDVMTLDVEMPGMSGLDYLAEIMASRPMPVIMFSTRTQAGAADSVEALRLGAIDCFPKPRVASPAELDKIIVKLSKRIKSAKNAPLPSVGKAAPAPAPAMDWNGRLIAVGADAASTRSMFDIFASFPANCPPTIVVQHLGPDLAATLIDTLAGAVAPRVVLAQDGLAIEQGCIYLAPPGDAHVVVDRWPDGHVRMVPRDPVAGERPSISILFAGVARAAGAEAVALLLGADGDDGEAGIRAVEAAGGYHIVPAENRADGYRLGRRMASQPVSASDVGKQLMKLCDRAA